MVVELAHVGIGQEPRDLAAAGGGPARRRRRAVLTGGRQLRHVVAGVVEDHLVVGREGGVSRAGGAAGLGPRIVDVDHRGNRVLPGGGGFLDRADAAVGDPGLSRRRMPDVERAAGLEGGPAGGIIVRRDHVPAGGRRRLEERRAGDPGPGGLLQPEVERLDLHRLPVPGGGAAGDRAQQLQQLLLTVGTDRLDPGALDDLQIGGLGERAQRAGLPVLAENAVGQHLRLPPPPIGGRFEEEEVAPTLLELRGAEDRHANRTGDAPLLLDLEGAAHLPLHLLHGPEGGHRIGNRAMDLVPLAHHFGEHHGLADLGKGTNIARRSNRRGESGDRQDRKHKAGENYNPRGSPHVELL